MCEIISIALLFVVLNFVSLLIHIFSLYLNFVCIDALLPIQHIFSHVRMIISCPGFNQH